MLENAGRHTEIVCRHDSQIGGFESASLQVNFGMIVSRGRAVEGAERRHI